MKTSANKILLARVVLPILLRKKMKLVKRKLY